jgi:hypothetical protein
MPGCHKPVAAPRAPRRFVTTAYVPGAGVLAPSVLPPRCPTEPARSPGGGCRIRVHHRRSRKTGPCFPVSVLRCARHRRAFTLYPLGHVPYGRAAVAPVHADGEPRRAADVRDHRRRRRGGAALAWCTTLFVAVLDAADGVAWPREGAAPHAQWQTQLRGLEQAAALVGLAPASAARVEEQLARQLEVPQLGLRSARKEYEAARGYVARGAAVRAVLGRLRADRRLVDRLLGAGALVGRWGEVERWDRTRGGARRTVFRAGGTATE